MSMASEAGNYISHNQGDIGQGLSTPLHSEVEFQSILQWFDDKTEVWSEEAWNFKKLGSIQEFVVSKLG